MNTDPQQLHADARKFLEGQAKFQVSFDGSGIHALLQSRSVRAGVSLTNRAPADSELFRYELDDLLALGRTGAVFAAHERNMRRNVAIKVIRSQTAGDEQLSQFVREAQVAAQLDHPSILPVYELGLDDHGNAYMVMKRVYGRTLQKILTDIRAGNEKAIHAYPLRRLLDIFMRACEAVQFAHDRGIVHCDLRPENILVGKFNEVRIMRWREAYILAADGKQPGGNRHSPNARQASGGLGGLDPSSMSMADFVRLSADRQRLAVDPEAYAYLSTEQASAAPTLSPRTDVYSLGAILYQILTLHRPVSGESKVDVLRQILANKITPMSKIEAMCSQAGDLSDEEDGTDVPHLRHCPGGKIPRALDELAQRAMQPNAQRRLGTASQVREAILRWTREVDRTKDATSFYSDWYRFGQRHRHAVSAGFLVCAIMIAGLFLLHGVLRTGLNLAEQAEKGSRKALELATLECDTLESKRRQGRAVEKPPEPKYWEHALQAVEALEKTRESCLIRSQLAFAVGDVDSVREWLMPVFEDMDDREQYDLAYRIYIAASATRGPRRQLSFTQMQEPIDEEQNEDVDVDADADVEPQDLGTTVTWNTDDLELTSRQLKAELERLNEAFSMPQDALRLEEGIVHFSVINEINLADISPLQDLPISHLVLHGTGVEDLSALAGMQLRSLSLYESVAVHDLTPLAGLPLQSLDLSGTMVSDLTPLAGMPLTKLFLDGAPVLSLAALNGMPLAELSASGTEVRDLRPLAGMSLEVLGLNRTPVSNLEPLEGQPLRVFGAKDTVVTNIKPLAGMPLRTLMLSNSLVSDLSPLAESPLERLNLDLSNLRLRSLEPLRGLSIRRITLTGCGYIRSLAPLSECKDLQQVALPMTAPGLKTLAELPNLKTIIDGKGSRHKASEYFKSPE